MLDDAIKTQLKAYLGRLQQPVELVASLDERESSTEMRSLLRDIAADRKSTRLNSSHTDISRMPSSA